MNSSRSSRRAAQSRAELGSLPQRIAALESMTMRELRETWAEVFGYASASHNHAYMRKKIAWRLQEVAEGGLSKRARERIAELAPNAPVHHRPLAVRPAAQTKPPASARDPRVPPAGTVLRRSHGGALHEVTVLESGFTYKGAGYPSLSTIAKAITGTTWNGLVFFGLAARAAAKGKQ
jgi:Protein of unknown function (DUF2924)